MIAELRAPTVGTEPEVDLLVAFTVDVVYTSPVDDPVLHFGAVPASATAVISQTTASITLTTSISGSFIPERASATFTTDSEGNLLRWRDQERIPIAQPGNIGTVSGDGEATLVIPVNFNPALPERPKIDSFRAFVSCTKADGSGTVTIETPDPTIVYVQPPG